MPPEIPNLLETLINTLGPVVPYSVVPDAVFFVSFFAGFAWIIGIDNWMDPDIPNTAHNFITPCYMTTHGSCYWNGLDEALTGTWTLVSQTLTTPQGVRENPFSGHTLYFAIGSEPGTNFFWYTEDYSSEKVDDVSLEGLNSSCTVEGVIGGKYYATYSGSAENINFNTPIVVDQLRIIPAGGSPTVTCSAGGSEVTSNAASAPLMGAKALEGDYVLYTYSIAGGQLTLVQENPYAPVVVTSVFIRQ